VIRRDFRKALKLSEMVARDLDISPPSTEIEMKVSLTRRALSIQQQSPFKFSEFSLVE